MRRLACLFPLKRFLQLQDVDSYPCGESFERTTGLVRDFAMAMVTLCSLVRPVLCSNASVRAEQLPSEAMSLAQPGLRDTPLLHSVTVVDRQRGVTHKFSVPEDQYILHTGEDQNIVLPFSCRHGCCTACAVRVKSGQLHQPEALGISAELKAKGYALLCVGYALSDLEVETQDEDEVYWLQFGQYFARGPIVKDEYALELAMGDE